MDGREHTGCEIGSDQLAAPLRDAKCRPEKGLRRGGAEADKHLRLDEGDLRLDPGTAGTDLQGVGLLVNAPFAAGLEFEVLYYVCHISGAPIDAGLGKASVKQAPGRPDEGPPQAIFPVPGCLPDQHERGSPWPFAEYGLGCCGVKRTGGTAARELPKLRQVGAVGDQRRRGVRRRCHTEPSRQKHGTTRRAVARRVVVPRRIDYGRVVPVPPGLVVPPVPPVPVVPPGERAGALPSRLRSRGGAWNSGMLFSWS